MGDEQDPVEALDADDPEDMVTTEALPATQPEIDERRFRLRIQPLTVTGQRQPNTELYGRKLQIDRILGVNEDDVRISIVQPSHERFSQDLVLRVERDVMRVHRMRYDSWCKGKKTFEDLDESHWVTEDQLRTSLSPMLVAELESNWLPYKYPVLEVLRNRLLMERISNSFFSSLQRSTA